LGSRGRCAKRRPGERRFGGQCRRSWGVNERAARLGFWLDGLYRGLLPRRLQHRNMAAPHSVSTATQIPCRMNHTTRSFLSAGCTAQSP
jgi:hypothetical protein